MRGSGACRLVQRGEKAGAVKLLHSNPPLSQRNRGGNMNMLEANPYYEGSFAGGGYSPTWLDLLMNAGAIQ